MFALQENSILAEFVTLYVDPGRFWFGAFRNFNICVWHTHATMEDVARIDATNPARTAAHPEKITTVHIIHETVLAPEPAVRDRFNAMHARWGHTVGCAAIIIEQHGFMGVAMRAAIAGMSMLTPKHYRIRVFDAVTSAAPWIAEHHGRSTGVVIDADDMSDVLIHARLLGEG